MKPASIADETCQHCILPTQGEFARNRPKKTAWKQREKVCPTRSGSQNGGCRKVLRRLTLVVEALRYTAPSLLFTQPLPENPLKSQAFGCVTLGLEDISFWASLTRTGHP